MEAPKNSQRDRMGIENVAPDGTAIGNDEKEIDLLELLYALLEHAKWIIAASLIGMLIAGAYTMYMVTPQYKATSKLYVLNSQDSVVNLADLQIGNYLASDYIEIFNTWEVKEMVRTNLGLNYSYDALGGMVSVTNPSDTRILYITVTSANPQEAADIANEYAKVVSDYVSNIMSTERPNTFSEALVPTRPFSPSKTKNALIGFMIGFILSAGIFTLRFIMDDKIKSEDDILKYTGVPVLAVVPIMGQKSPKSKYYAK